MSNRPWSADPLLDEVDEARRRILAECDNDPRKALESYLEYQKQFADRLVDYSEPASPGKSAA
jgi:Mg/Co/Ni transporter MgtE